MGMAPLLLAAWLAVSGPPPPGHVWRPGDAFTLRMSYTGTAARRVATTVPWKLAAESQIKIDRRHDGLAVTVEATRAWNGRGLPEGDPATLTLAEDRRLLLFANGAVAHVDREGEEPLWHCTIPNYSPEPTPPGPVAQFWALLVMLHATARDGTDSEKTVRSRGGPITSEVKMTLSHDDRPCPDRKPGSCRRGVLTSAFQDSWDPRAPPREVTTSSLLLDRQMRPWRFTRRTVQEHSGRVITFVVDFRPAPAPAAAAE